ncbi:MAG: hypothetical protein Tsb002_24500 [Wenzhouxiangellaceae bacterium]
MTSNAILFVDSQPLRSAPLRAYLLRYDLRQALSSELPAANAPAPQVSSQGEYCAWLIVLDQITDIERWRALAKPASLPWLALHPDQREWQAQDWSDTPFHSALSLSDDPARLAQWLNEVGCPLQNAAADPFLHSMPLLDDDAAMAAAMGDRGLVNELRAMLRDDMVQRIPQVAKELSRGEVAEAAETVHRLVGGCAYCGAKAMQTASLELENCLRQREVDKVDAAYSRWLLAAEQLLPALSG